MQKFVIKSAAGSGFYELDEEKKILRISIRKNWKTVFKKENGENLPVPPQKS